MPRQPERLPDYFTQEEALVRATDSADNRLVLRPGQLRKTAPER